MVNLRGSFLNSANIFMGSGTFTIFMFGILLEILDLCKEPIKLQLSFFVLLINKGDTYLDFRDSATCNFEAPFDEYNIVVKKY